MAAIIDYRGKSPNKTTAGIPLVTAKIVKGGRISTPEEFIAEADYEEWMSRGIPQAGDVVMTTEAPLGEVAQLDGSKVALAQRIITLRGKPGVLDQNFLKFLMQSQTVQEELRSRATGTTVVGIRQSELRKVNLTLPPYAVQRVVGNILGTLDDKIELNRRMNETLEDMARAIFKSWFVDFDPVRAQASEFVAEGILQIGDGYRAKNEELGTEGVPFIRAGELNNGFDTANAGRLKPERVSAAKGKQSIIGDVAFTSKGTVGRFARVSEHTEPFIYSPQICFWRSLCPEILHPAILYCWMQSGEFISQIDGVAGQTDMAPYVSLRDQKAMEIPRFHESQGQVGEQIASLLRMVAEKQAESRSLTTLRDTLLPKLLVGELVCGHSERTRRCA